MSKHNTYSAESMSELTQIVYNWQTGVPLSHTQGTKLSQLVTNVSNDRWNAHFRNHGRDWQDTKVIRENVPLAFMEYLRYPRSLRTKVEGRWSCPLHVPPVYSTLPYILYEFRRQFPRVLTILIAQHVGVSLRQVYEPNNVRYMVDTPIYKDLHSALCTMRKVAKEQQVDLYTAHSYELRLEVFQRLAVGKHVRYLDNPYDTVEASQLSRSNLRMCLAINAANDILRARSQAHYDACNSQVRMNPLYELYNTNTNYEV